MQLFRTILAGWIVGISAVFSSVYAATPSDIPSLPTLIQRVMQASAGNDAQYHEFNHHYLYTRDRVTEFYDTSGNLKDRDAKQSTNNPLPTLAIALPQPEIRPIEYQRTTPADEQPNLHGLSLGKKEDLLNPELIKRYKLTIVDREMLNGRPTYLVDFKPASGNLPLLNIKDRFLDCVTGRAWVDAGDYVLVKVDLHLTQKVSVLDGLAGTLSRFNFSFDRERTADGFWFTRSLNWNLQVREAGYQRVIIHHEQINDPQKMM
jgi:hypothetical protein